MARTILQVRVGSFDTIATFRQSVKIGRMRHTTTAILDFVKACVDSMDRLGYLLAEPVSAKSFQEVEMILENVPP